MTLRIQKSAERELVVFTLAGRIQAGQLSDLEALLKSESSAGEIVLDLKEVKLVDLDAVRFLAQLEAGSTRIRNAATYIREWISHERNGMQPRGRGNSTGLGE